MANPITYHAMVLTGLTGAIDDNYYPDTSDANGFSTTATDSDLYSAVGDHKAAVIHAISVNGKVIHGTTVADHFTIEDHAGSNVHMRASSLAGADLSAAQAIYGFSETGLGIHIPNGFNLHIEKTSSGAGDLTVVVLWKLA